ncbi:MAG: hypothetical protein ABSH12_01875 [Endomicrobiales bacterium]
MKKFALLVGMLLVPAMASATITVVQSSNVWTTSEGSSSPLIATFASSTTLNKKCTLGVNLSRDLSSLRMD